MVSNAVSSLHNSNTRCLRLSPLRVFYLIHLFLDIGVEARNDESLLGNGVDFTRQEASVQKLLRAVNTCGLEHLRVLQVGIHQAVDADKLVETLGIEPALLRAVGILDALLLVVRVLLTRDDTNGQRVVLHATADVDGFLEVVHIGFEQKLLKSVHCCSSIFLIICMNS